MFRGTSYKYKKGRKIKGFIIGGKHHKDLSFADDMKAALTTENSIPALFDLLKIYEEAKRK